MRGKSGGTRMGNTTSNFTSNDYIEFEEINRTSEEISEVLLSSEDLDINFFKTVLYDRMYSDYSSIKSYREDYILMTYRNVIASPLTSLSKLCHVMGSRTSYDLDGDIYFYPEEVVLNQEDPKAYTPKIHLSMTRVCVSDTWKYLGVYKYKNPTTKSPNMEVVFERSKGRDILLAIIIDSRPVYISSKIKKVKGYQALYKLEEIGIFIDLNFNLFTEIYYNKEEI